MSKNILLLGTAGTGKTTLVNALAGQKKAKAATGNHAMQKIWMYENEDLGLNFFDTKGFEFNIWNRQKLILSIKKLIRNGLMDNKGDKNEIDCIWYCVSATDGKLQKENMLDLKIITRNCQEIPIIVVLTKAYSKIEAPDIAENVKKQFEKYSSEIHIISVMPVVAEPFYISEDNVVGQYGIMDLIELTQKKVNNEAEEKLMTEFRMKQRRHSARILIDGAAAAGAMIAALPLVMHDTVILATLETGMIARLGNMYGLKEEGSKKEHVRELFGILLTAGTVGAAAKTGVSAIKAIPGIGLTAGALNAIMAVSVIEILGHTCIDVFEKIDKGEIDIKKKDEIKRVVDEFVDSNMPLLVNRITEQIKKNKESGKKQNLKDFMDAVIKRK